MVRIAVTGLSVLLALLGAMLFAVSASLQQHSARTAVRRMDAGETRAEGRTGAVGRTGADALPGGSSVATARRETLTVSGRVRRLPARASGPVPPPLRRLAAGVARDPLWWWGWSAGAAGFGAQALALHLGSIAVVQSLIVTQLLFALPLSGRFAGRRPLRRDWWGSAAVCAGLVVLVPLYGGVRPSSGQRSRAWLVVVAAATLVALSLVIARLLRSRAQARAVALAVAAGVCFAMTAVFLVFAGDDVSRYGLPAAVFGWPPLGLAASTVLGTVLVQTAFAGGTLPAALTAMTVTDPVASWIAGVVVPHAGPAVDAGMLWATAAAGVLIASGVALLATSPTLRDERLARR